jgi:hypothetical protein
VNVPAPSRFRADVDQGLDDIVMRMLEPRAKNRTASARDVEEQLDRWLADQGAPSGRALLQRLLDEKKQALRSLADAEDEERRTLPHEAKQQIVAMPPRMAARPDAATIVRKAPSDPFSEADSFDGAVEITRPAGVPMPTFDAPRTEPMPPPSPPSTRVAVKAGRAAVPLPAVPDAGARLPSSSTSFVGRRAELTRIRALFDDGARLVTLLGPGGTGKTRLALRFAEQAAVERSFPGGAWFVDWTGAHDAAGALATLARARRRPPHGQERARDEGHARLRHLGARPHADRPRQLRRRRRARRLHGLVLHRRRAPRGPHASLSPRALPRHVAAALARPR